MTEKPETLAETRERYIETVMQLQAIGQSIAARKEQAQQIKADLLAATPAEAEQIKLDLIALNRAHLADLETEKQIDSQWNDLAGALTGFYRNSQVDWQPALHHCPTALFSGWGNTYSPGYELEVPVALTDPELEAIRDLVLTNTGYGSARVGVKHRRFGDRDGNRLVVQYAAYRGGAWTDLDGRTILKAIASCWTTPTQAQQTDEFLSSLAIFAS